MKFEEYQDLKRSIMLDVMDNNSIKSETLLNHVINEYLVDSKRIDHEDVTIGYFDQTIDRSLCRMNGYMFNTTRERLQLFLVDELSLESKDLHFVSKSEDYATLLKSPYNFIKKVFLRHFFSGDNPPIESVSDELTKAFISNLSMSENVKDIDTVEIFLITLNLSVRNDSHGNQHLREDISVTPPDPITFSIHLLNEKINKKINFKYSIVDLNFLHRIHTSINGREPIKIELCDDEALDFIEVANEDDFKSYLTALPGEFLFKIYSDYSSRLLERNIRAFLDFKTAKNNVNSGMKRTIIEEPHKFVAFNNGLTITCNNIEIREIQGKNKIVGFDDFQIVNGGQTTASLYFTAMQKYDISKVQVMAKINMIGSHDEEFDNFVADISNYSNAQNKVNKVDLRSNEPVLQKIKILSNSVITPVGKKWFYEKSRGELGAVKRKNNWSPTQLNNVFPKIRRFQNTELAKYYSSWGNIPYKVKKGGESVFVDFIDAIKDIGVNNINKSFFENLIARVILFRNLEKVHGQGKNAIGQLRSAVIPYSISVVYSYASSLSNKDNVYSLDFETIWKDGVITEEVEDFFLELMKSMYNWINQYKTSTDISENTKKEELWSKIVKSSEVQHFLLINKPILDKVIVIQKKNLNEFFNFSELAENVKYHSLGYDYFKKLKLEYLTFFNYGEIDTLDNILENKIKKISTFSNYLNSFGINKNIQSDIATKKSKIAKEKFLQQEINKKPTLLLKSSDMMFLEEMIKKVASIDSEKENAIRSTITKDEGFVLILEALENAYNDNDFSKLLTKAIVSQKKGVGVKYQVEYLKTLREFGIMPTMFDMYQLLPLYNK